MPDNESAIKAISFLKPNSIFFAGVTVSTCSGILFHPIDQALYLRSTDLNKQAFFSKKYFTKPFNGLRQTIFQKSFFGSIYFISQGQLKHFLYPCLKTNYQLQESSAHFIVGMCAGSMNALLSNPNHAVKYFTQDKKGGDFFCNAYEMFKRGGTAPFLKGIGPCFGRDVTFGCTYELLRRDQASLSGTYPFLHNLFAASIATICASPWNFSRNMQYKELPERKPLSSWQLWKNLWQDSQKIIQNENTGGINLLRYSAKRVMFFQRHLQIGLGATRVGVGMAVGQMGFDWLTEDKFSNLTPSKK